MVSDSERAPLFSNHRPTDTGSSYTTTRQGQRDDEPRSTITVMLIIILFVVAPLCALFGVAIDRSIGQGVRERLTHDAEHLRQLAVTYKQQALSWQSKSEQWKHRSEHFEEEVKERIEQEKREREQAGLYWGDFVGYQCASSGHRKYYARLLNLTPRLFALGSCKLMTATINGITFGTPRYCEDRGSEGVFGHWVVENDAVCSTYWESVVRKDCSAPGAGTRRYEAKLGDTHRGEDPEILCLSTPITIYGQLLQHPTACANRGRGDTPEYWGVWDVPVGDCS